MTVAQILATHPDHQHIEGICKPWLDRMGAPEPQQAADELRAAGWRFTLVGGYYDAWVSPEGITFGTTMYAWLVMRYPWMNVHGDK